ncbi:glycosyltransferase family 4 protein [Modestobacter sp. I12A-02662]|uniref:glycosyltransferase family 4 protein n=1 Tax=Modestobacter sp. I12A-02662 TaxID=1730496 RepID=UPI0034DE4404
MTGSAGHVHMTLRLPDRTGAARMALAFGSALRGAGFDLTLVHGSVPADGRSILPDFAAIGAATVLESRLDRPWGPLLVPDLAARVRRDAGRVVIGVNQRDRMPALLAASRAGVPGVLVVGNQHHFWGPRPVAALKRRSYWSVVAARTSLAVCTSTVVRDEMTAAGVPADRAVVLPNGIAVPPPVQLAGPERARLRAEMGARDGDLLLVNVGRLDLQKGQDLLLEALARPPHPPPVHVALVGTTDSAGAARRTAEFAASLHRTVRDRGLDGAVSFLGWREDVGRLLAAADAYVHAARWEGPALPLAVMEAMAAGCPAVFPDCSGRPPWFEPGRHGLMARSGDPASLRRRIDELVAMSGPQRSALGGEGARLIREHYTLEECGRAFVALIRDVVDRAGS